MARIKDIRPDPIYFEGGGKKRTIKYDLNAFAELERRYGSVEAAMTEFQTGNMKAIRVILWAGLIHEEAILDEDGEPTGYNITPYQVGGWVMPGQMQEVSSLIDKAMLVAIPDQEAVLNTPEVQQQLKNMGINIASDGGMIATVEGEDTKNVQPTR
jgi:hypothetical protein